MAEDNPVVVEYLDSEALAVITLNRPQVLNALDTATAMRLCEVLEEIAERTSVRAIVITGSGERAFSAGADLRERSGMTASRWKHQHRVFEGMYRSVRHMRKPILAAVNGVAVGGGCELAMSCDFIIASRGARFGQPEVTRGFIPGGGGTQLLPRLVPQGVAMQLLMTGDLISAEDAWRCGLVNMIVAAEELMSETLRLARRIAANSPIAVQQAKRSVKLGLGCQLDQAIDIELNCYQRTISHPDRHEGVKAFHERRPPIFLNWED